MKRKKEEEHKSLISRGIERAREMVSGGNGDNHDEGPPPDRRYKVGERYLNDEELGNLPTSSSLDKARDVLNLAKAGGRMTPQVQLRALELGLTPNKEQLRSMTMLDDRHIFYMATAMTWAKIAENDPRDFMTIWSEYFMELRRSYNAYTLMATMRQAGVDTEADAITKMGGRL